MGFESTFHILNLNLYPSAANDIVSTPYDTKASSIGCDLRDIVGGEGIGTYERCIYDKAVVCIERHTDGVKRCVPSVGIFSAEPAQCYMRESLRHAVSAPHRIREFFQFCLHSGIYSSTAYDKISNLHEAYLLLRHLHGIIYLQRHHSSEMDDGIQRTVAKGEWMTSGRYIDELQTAHDGAYHHHLCGDIIEGHTKQSRVARLESEEVARYPRTGFHTFFLHQHSFRNSRGTAGMNGYLIGTVVPLFQKFFENHSLSPFISIGIGILSVKRS